jgi:hypothetical protein
MAVGTLTVVRYYHFLFAAKTDARPLQTLHGQVMQSLIQN